MYRILISIIIILTIFSCAPRIQVESQPESLSGLELLHQDISYLLSDPNLFRATIGLYVESLDNGEVIYRQNEHKLFIPASNMKLYTSAVCLLKFGPHFSYVTHFYNRGRIENGVLNGDLIIRGSGDPSINGHHQRKDVRVLLNSWADSLKNHGIRRINGNLVGDVSYFQYAGLGSGWAWDDEIFYYAAKTSALSLNDNCVDVTVEPAAEAGQPPVVTLNPPTNYFRIENNARTVPPDSIRTISVWRDRSETILRIENEMPVNYNKYTTWITADEPALYFVTVLREILEDNGIQIAGELQITDDADKYPYDTLTPVFSHRSPALSELLKVLNKRSHNLYAEQLITTLGAEYGKQATAREGARVALSRLNAIGIPENEIMIVDGSGLARKNLISPAATVTLLRYMARHKYFEPFFESLPVSGVDGTLRNRMLETSAEQRVHAKTGYVGQVRNLSGYVYSADEELFMFSILVNHYAIPTPAINLLQDRICERLSRFHRNK